MNGFAFLANADQIALLQLFWFAALLDFPRYVISALVVSGAYIFSPIRPKRLTGPRPSVSVVLAGHNEEHALRRCVDGLLEQTIARDGQPLQIVVVDDGSTDQMFRVASELRREGKVQEIFRLHLRGGKSAAVNLALTAAKGEIVIIADIDTTFDRDAFEIMLGYFDDPKVGAVGGALGARNRDKSLVTRHQAIEYAIGISLGRRVADALNILAIVSGAFGAFRRKALDSIGAQDVEVGEDADMTMKLRRAGWRIRFAPTARGLTDVPETLTQFTNQRLRWDRGLVTIWLRKYRGTFDPRTRNFSILEVFALIDVLLFQIVLTVVFPFYLLWLFYYFEDIAPTVIVAMMLVYAALDFLVFLIAVTVERDHPVGLLVYVPFYSLMQVTIARGIRLVAVFQELIFRASYRDPYVPERVMRVTERV